MSFSEVQICNLALLNFGDVTISSLTASTKEARACNVFYPMARDFLLQSHPWNFAMTRADISAQLTTTPAFQWDYAYTLPSDCLQVWELYGSDEDWVVEGNLLLTDLDEEIYIRYIKALTTTGLFRPAFVKALSTYLGAILAAKIAGNSTRRAELMEQFDKVDLPEAYRLNAIEGNEPRHKDSQPLDKGNFTWQTER